MTGFEGVDGVEAGGHPPRAEPDITASEGLDRVDVASQRGDPSHPVVDGNSGGQDARPLRQRIEAILVVVDEPVGVAELARVLGVPAGEVTEMLASLRSEYLDNGRGFELRDVAGGWRLYSSPECAADVERFVLDGAQARLTHAALETLAVVAYRQPVSRQAIAAIRGVSVDGVVRTLLSRNLIAEAGLGAGGATLYVTTPFFLSRLGLSSLDDLPSLAPYLPVDLDEFEDSL